MLLHLWIALFITLAGVHRYNLTLTDEIKSMSKKERRATLVGPTFNDEIRFLNNYNLPVVKHIAGVFVDGNSHIILRGAGMRRFTGIELTMVDIYNFSS